MVKTDNFQCARCGHACRMTVKVTVKDIERIKQSPVFRSKHKSIIEVTEPISFDPSTGKDALKMIGGACIFLTKENGLYACTIHEHRPDICRAYPFFKEGVAPCTALGTRKE